MLKILDKDVALVSCSASLRSWKQLQTSLSSEVCSRRSPHPFLKEDFYLFIFFQEKIKAKIFRLAWLWCGPNTTHDLTFPRLLHCLISVRKGQTAQCCFQATKLNLFPCWGMSWMFRLAFFFETFVNNSEVLWSVRVWQKGEDPNADIEAVRNKKQALFYEAKVQKLKMQAIHGLWQKGKQKRIKKKNTKRRAGFRKWRRKKSWNTEDRRGAKAFNLTPGRAMRHRWTWKRREKDKDRKWKAKLVAWGESLQENTGHNRIQKPQTTNNDGWFHSEKDGILTPSASINLAFTMLFCLLPATKSPLKIKADCLLSLACSLAPCLPIYIKGAICKMGQNLFLDIEANVTVLT